VIRIRTLRARLAIWIALAVAAAGAFHAGAAVIVFLAHERDEVEAGEVQDVAREEAEQRTVMLELAGATAALATALSLSAAGAGLWLAGKALAPLREAADRARRARDGAGELLLPVRGTGDEWDGLASVVNELLHDQHRSTERARTFSANAAHELRTPLTAMLGEVQVALRRPRSAEEYRTVLEGVEAEVTRLAAVVEALLTLSRTDSGELRARVEPFDLAAVVAEAARARKLEPAAAPPGPAIARGDPLLTRRVIDNLIDNALRHGGKRVEVRVERELDQVAVSVTDDGPGLAPAVRARLFERFNRQPGNAGGYGLGLAIAHALTAAQGGALRLDPTVSGTRFVLALPPGGAPAGGAPAPA